MSESTGKKRSGPLLRVVDDNRRVRAGSVTYEEYTHLPDDGSRFEVANSNLELLSPAPSPRHQLWVAAVFDVLRETCASEFVLLIAPVDVIFGPKEVRQPDIVAVKHARTAIITTRGVEGAPDLVVEVLSPHSAKRDKVDKTDAYARHGVPEYWIVTPEVPMIEQYVFVPGGLARTSVYTGKEVMESTVAPCASFTVEDLAHRVPNVGN